MVLLANVTRLVSIHIYILLIVGALVFIVGTLQLIATNALEKRKLNWKLAHRGGLLST